MGLLKAKQQNILAKAFPAVVDLAALFVQLIADLLSDKFIMIGYSMLGLDFDIR